MGIFHENGAYSSDVRMHLECDGEIYRVAELGPDTMMLHAGQPIPRNGYARLVVEIDGDRTVHDIFVTCTDISLPEMSFA